MARPDRLRLPPTQALYATARLSIKPKAAIALEIVLKAMRPRRARKPWWRRAEHLIAAATEAEDLCGFAKDQAEKLAEQEGGESLAAIAGEAERELREVARRLRLRVETQDRLHGVEPETILRPTVVVKFSCHVNRPVIADLAESLARRNPRRHRGPKLDRRPLVALRKDVEVLAAHLAPRVSWPEEWCDLVAMTDLAATANDLAERIEDAVLPPSPKGRRTRRYVPRSEGAASEEG